MHYFVNKERGKASDYRCVDCDGVARDWSRIHGTNDDRDPWTFEPRCRKCHMAYDDHKRNQRGKPMPMHIIEAARIANIGNKYNLGRKRPDTSERNRRENFSRKCEPGCSCGKHRKSAAE